MKLIKYFIGSLIISFGILLLIATMMMSVQFSLPQNTLWHWLLTWFITALCVLPFAPRFIRV